MSNFLIRTLTGICIVVFVIGGIGIHPLSFYFTVMIMLSGTQYEYYRIIQNTGVKPRIGAGLTAGIVMYTVSTIIAAGLVTGKAYLVLVPFILLIMLLELYSNQERPFDNLAHTFFPLIYTALPFSMFPFLAFHQAGFDSLLAHPALSFSPAIVLGFFLLLWTNDTGAYLSGITLGKHKLFERISPKKTWEGFAGGLIFTVAVAWLFSGMLGTLSATGWMIVAVIISVSGTYGDLIESMLKRSAGVKDSGSIMPGHGGFLDRFDSVIISFPLVYLYITLFG